MGPICIEFLPYFCKLFAFVFFLGSLYLCSHLPCTFDGWVPFLDFFYIHGFPSSLVCKPFVNCRLPLLALLTKARILCLDSL
jgi:hypothetical protein